MAIETIYYFHMIVKLLSDVILEGTITNTPGAFDMSSLRIYTVSNRLNS